MFNVLSNCYVTKKGSLDMLYRMYRQTRSKNILQETICKNLDDTKEQHWNIARAVTANLWYEVTEDKQRIKPCKCTLCFSAKAKHDAFLR